jgi:hypothetical protein
VNWIDKIFKDKLGSRKFSDELRQKGKADLEFLLAREMPVTTAKTGKGGLFYGGLSILVMMVTLPLGIWLFQNNSEHHEKSYSLSFGQMDQSFSTAALYSRAGSSGKWTVAQPKVDDELHPQSQLTNGLEEETRDEVKDQAAMVADNPPIKTSTQAEEVQTASPPDGDERVSSHLKTTDFITKGGSQAQKDKTVNELNVDETLGGNVDEKQKNKTEQMVGVLAPSKSEIIDTYELENSAVISPDGENTLEGINATEGSQTVAQTKNEETNTLLEAGRGESSGSGRLKSEASDISKTSQETTTENADGLVSVTEGEIGGVEEENGKALSGLALTNLSFSDLQGSLGADLSQYKLLSPKRMSVSLWAGYAFVGKTVNGGSDNYINIREEKEEAIWSVPTGFTFDYYLNSKWTLSIGAGFSEYGEDLRYEYEYEREGYVDGRYGDVKSYNTITRLDSVRVITGIYQGHWEYYFDYLETDTAVKNNNGSTQWSYVEIPILVGYRFGSKKLKPWLQLGVSAGIPYNSNFRYWSTSGDGLQSIQEKKSGISDFTISGLMYLGVDYYINKHFSIRLNGFGSYQLTPAYKFEDVEQRYYRVGATLGIAYNL